MKIEVGKFYKTRDGRKVGPMWLPEYGGGDYASKDLGKGGMWKEDGYSVFEGAKDSPTLVAEWTDTPEVGTLQEIGAQVGDVVQCSDGQDYEVMPAHPKGYMSRPVAYNEKEGYFDLEDSGTFTFRIISRVQPKPEQTGPVRNVTRKEIVTGVYGFIWVSPVQGSNNQVTVGMRNSGDDTMQQVGADDLTAAITTLTAIRDALVENEG